VVPRTVVDVSEEAVIYCEIRGKGVHRNVMEDSCLLEYDAAYLFVPRLEKVFQNTPVVINSFSA
jgi:hypothetical protein